MTTLRERVERRADYYSPRPEPDEAPPTLDVRKEEPDGLRLRTIALLVVFISVLFVLETTAAFGVAWLVTGHAY
jgi:hypothetical protein